MTRPLWTSEDLRARLNAEILGGEWQVSGVSIDSRTLQPGDLFIALKGERHDGHRFVEQALRDGAAAAMVCEDMSHLGPDASLAKVENTDTGLVALGVLGRDRAQAKVIGITGSVGKTGTKEAMAAALARTGLTHASERSFNNQYGVPLTLARLPQDADFAVLEMGMNHAGELAALTDLVRPHVALITTVAAVHLEFFDSVEAIADAKAEIMKGLVPGGTAVLPFDNEHFPRLRDWARDYGVDRVVSFGLGHGADVMARQIHERPECTVVTADVAGTIFTYKIGIPGKHWVSNSLGLLACVMAADADLGLAGLALAALEAPNGRGRRHQVTFRDDGLLIVDESYNASPPAVQAALEDLGRTERPGSSGRRVAVLGDMLELGEDGPAVHRDLAGIIEESGIDRVITVGVLMGELYDVLPEQRRAGHAADAAGALTIMRDEIRDGDVIMVKGSNAIGLSAIVDELLAMEESASVVADASGW